MVAAVDSAAFQVGAVRPLFQTRQGQGARWRYDVSGDGQRFLVINTLVEEAASTPITLVVNWTAGLRK